MEAPAENRAMSIPTKLSSASSLHSTHVVPNSSSIPADRLEASGTSSETGKLLLARISRISWPTAPVAPTTATLYFLLNSPLLVGPAARGDIDIQRYQASLACRFYHQVFRASETSAERSREQDQAIVVG